MDAMETKEIDPIADGSRAYEEWREDLLALPESRQEFDDESIKLDLWLQLVRARKDAGLTQIAMSKRIGVSQAQVARIEKRGYDAYTLSTLRRYVEALGPEYQLDVTIRQTPVAERPRQVAITT